MLRIQTRLAPLVAAATLATLPTATFAQSREWSTAGSGTEIVATDCTDCGDDIGMIFQCRGLGQPALVTAYWAAAAAGREGEVENVEISVDGKLYFFPARVSNQELVGYVPEFEVPVGDGLIDALQGGRSVTVGFLGEVAEIGLRRSRAALDAFKRECGWDDAAAGLLPPDPAYAPPGNGEPLWFATRYDDPNPTASTMSVVFGVPETDGVAFGSHCVLGGGERSVSVDFIVDTGALADGARTEIRLLGESLLLTLPARIANAGGEFAGATTEISLDSPLWRELRKADQVTFGVTGASPTTVPTNGAAEAVPAFLAGCSSGIDPAPVERTAAAVDPVWPIAGKSWGGVLRAGPGTDFERLAALAEGTLLTIVERTPAMMGDYPWFKVEVGTLVGYQWGGILCAVGRPVEGAFQTC